MTLPFLSPQTSVNIPNPTFCLMIKLMTQRTKQLRFLNVLMIWSQPLSLIMKTQKIKQICHLNVLMIRSQPPSLKTQKQLCHLNVLMQTQSLVLWHCFKASQNDENLMSYLWMTFQLIISHHVPEETRSNDGSSQNSSLKLA